MQQCLLTGQGNVSEQTVLEIKIAVTVSIVVKCVSDNEIQPLTVTNDKMRKSSHKINCLNLDKYALQTENNKC